MNVTINLNMPHIVLAAQLIVLCLHVSVIIYRHKKDLSEIKNLERKIDYYANRKV